MNSHATDSRSRQIFRIAEEFDVPIDVHADYFDSPELKTLEMLADITIERGFEGRVVAGDCCALAVYPDDDAARVVKQARIDVVVMPVGNLQMLGGPKRTPYNRGSSRVLELLDAGINVAAAGDNVHDIWTRFSRYDPVETGLLTCLSAGMRTDAQASQKPAAPSLGIVILTVSLPASAANYVHSRPARGATVASPETISVVMSP